MIFEDHIEVSDFIRAHLGSNTDEDLADILRLMEEANTTADALLDRLTEIMRGQYAQDIVSFWKRKNEAPELSKEQKVEYIRDRSYRSQFAEGWLLSYAESGMLSELSFDIHHAVHRYVAMLDDPEKTDTRKLLLGNLREARRLAERLSPNRVSIDELIARAVAQNAKES